MALPDATAPILSYLPIYGTQADENSDSFLQTMTSWSSPMSPSHEDVAHNFFTQPFCLTWERHLSVGFVSHVFVQ